LFKEREYIANGGNDRQLLVWQSQKKTEREEENRCDEETIFSTACRQCIGEQDNLTEVNFFYIVAVTAKYQIEPKKR